MLYNMSLYLVPACVVSKKTDNIVIIVKKKKGIERVQKYFIASSR